MKVNKIPEDIREYLRYEDGKLYWTKKPCNKVSVGDEAGCLCNFSGYILIGFKGTLYRAHRIVWFLVNDQQPTEMLDHINNNKSDNRRENLRAATYRQNNQNRTVSRNNSSGVKGVYWNKKANKWLARLNTEEKRKSIGYFTDLAEAEKAIKEARQQIHGEYANHG